MIEAAMKDKLSEEIARRHGQVVSVQVRAVVWFVTVVPWMRWLALTRVLWWGWCGRRQIRNIDLPNSFESRLIEIELKKQDAQLATEEILLAQVRGIVTRVAAARIPATAKLNANGFVCLQIIAVTEKQLRELRSQKEQLAIKLSQETENLRLVIEQNETQVKEQTARQLARLDAELSEFLAVYNQETENQQKEILHNKTVRTLASTSETCLTLWANPTHPLAGCNPRTDRRSLIN